MVTGRRFPRETIQRRLIIFWTKTEVLLFAFFFSQNYVIRRHCVRGHLLPFRIVFWSTRWQDFSCSSSSKSRNVICLIWKRFDSNKKDFSFFGKDVYVLEWAKMRLTIKTDKDYLVGITKTVEIGFPETGMFGWLFRIVLKFEKV